MSTSLARLRLREVVTEEDIEEAIRLTLAAKDSLRADQARQSTLVFFSLRLFIGSNEHENLLAWDKE